MSLLAKETFNKWRPVAFGLSLTNYATAGGYTRSSLTDAPRNFFESVFNKRAARENRPYIDFNLVRV